MPRGASPKREREYEELKERFKKEGRYKGRQAEVASRIVNKQRAMYGETKEDKEQEREGTDADRNLPSRHYRELTIPQVTRNCQSFPLKISSKWQATRKSTRTAREYFQPLKEGTAAQLELMRPLVARIVGRRPAVSVLRVYEPLQTLP